MFKRISVIGASGSGKSTLAQSLAEILQYPRLELDRAFWRENWTGASDSELEKIVLDCVSQDRWIIDGNYSRVQPHILRHADFVISTEIPFVLNLWRVTWRSLRRVFTKEELWAGNRESLKRMFTRDSIILWVWNTWRRRHDSTKVLYNLLVREEHSDFKAIPIYLRSTKERQCFLATLRRHGRLVRKALIYPTYRGSLLVFRHPETRLIEPVRGTIDQEEEGRNTAIRELLEEAGVDLSQSEKAGVRRFAVGHREWPGGVDQSGPMEFFLDEAFTVELEDPRQVSGWVHRVGGDGVDGGMSFEVFWLPLAEAAQNLTPATAKYLTELPTTMKSVAGSSPDGNST